MVDQKDDLIGYLVRDMPRDVMGKIRAAAAIHGMTTKGYIRQLFESHIKELERKGMKLSAPKGKVE